jgi:CHAT domain-containing protein/Tfp pilus assembly protein PilF
MRGYLAFALIMKSLIRISVLIFIALGANTKTTAQSDELISNVQKILQLYQQGSYGEVLKVSEKTLGLAQTEFGQQDPMYAIVLAVVALSQHEMGDAEKAEANYIRSLSVLKKNNSPEFNVFIGTIHAGLARIEYGKGNYDKSEKLLLESASILEKSVGVNDVNYSNTINDLGNLYKERGDYGKSESYLKQAAEIRKKMLGEKHAIYGVSLNNLGSLYEQMGDYEKAATHYEDAIIIWRLSLGNEHPLIANGTNNLAGLFVKYGAYEQAIKIYTVALDISEKAYGPKHEKYITTLTNIGNVFRQMRKLDEAETCLVKSLALRKEVLGENHLDYMFSLNNLGLVKMDKGLYNESEKLLLQALNLARTIVGQKHKFTSICTNNVGMMYVRSGNLAKAASYLRQSLSISLGRIDHVFPALNDKDKTYFYATIQKDFEFFNYFASTCYPKIPGIVGDMFNYTIATKALLLSTSNKIKKRILTSGDAALIELYQEWRNRKNQLAQVWQMSNADKAKAQIDEAALETEVNALEKKLSATSELFASSNDKTKYSWKDVQKALKPGEAVIEIIRFRTFNFEFTDTASYAAIIVSQSLPAPQIVILKDGNFLETRGITVYKNSIKNTILDTRSYDYFWKPIAEKLDGVKRVFVSPDGVYNEINLNSLYNTTSKKYLIEEIEIQQVTNTKDVLALPRRSVIRNAVMVGFPDYKTHPIDRFQSATPDAPTVSDSVKRAFTNTAISPLPGTLTEVNAIAEIFKAKNIETQTVTGVRANEGFLKKIESPSVLHIATHGFFLADVAKENEEGRGGFLGFESVRVQANPLLRSGILLAGAEKTFSGEKPSAEDGVLSAYEAMTMNLDATQLVVLSACETGLGEVRNGEGVYGFQRALIIAGAEAVVMSLWKVNDEVTQELMTEFYRYWVEDRTKRHAFLLAQNKIREKHPEPYYWAPFIMIGN